ncbi:hypothetical protein D3C72_1472550 [compost metagenome]
MRGQAVGLDLVGRGCGGVQIQVRHHHLRAFTRQGRRNRAAQSAAAAQHQRGLVPDTQIHLYLHGIKTRTAGTRAVRPHLVRAATLVRCAIAIFRAIVRRRAGLEKAENIQALHSLYE